jgi:hypothetical protein
MKRKYLVTIVISLLFIYIEDNVCIADSTNTSSFSKHPVFLERGISKFLNPIDSKYSIPADQNKRVIEVFNWWLKKILSEKTIPSSEYIKNNIMLYPSTKTTRGIDIATLQFNLSKFDVFIAQSGGTTSGRDFIITFKSRADKNINISSIKNLFNKEIFPATLDFSSKPFGDAYCYFLKDNKNSFLVFIKNNIACICIDKNRFSTSSPSIVISPNKWFDWLKNQSTKPLNERKLNNKFLYYLSPSIRKVSSDYRVFKDSFKGSFDLCDAQSILTFFKVARATIMSIPETNYLALECKTQDYEITWGIILYSYNKSNDPKARQLLLAEWDRELRSKESQTYFKCLLSALSKDWNKDFLTNSFWELVKKTQNIDVTKQIEVLLNKHGTDKDRIKFNKIKTAQD